MSRTTFGCSASMARLASNAATARAPRTDLVLEDRRDRPVLLGADPHVGVGPQAEAPQLLHLGVLVVDIVLHREAQRVKHTHVRAQRVQDARKLRGGWLGRGDASSERGEGAGWRVRGG